MGASNKIQDTNLEITQFRCPHCQQWFTDEDKQKDNWELYWDTSGVVKTKLRPISYEGFYLTILVRSLEHNDCPEVEKCHDCHGLTIKEKMIKSRDHYYCPPCSQFIEKKRINHYEYH